MQIHAAHNEVISDYDVFLDGVAISDVVVADDQSGFVATLKRTAGGQPVMTGAGAFEVTVRTGKVKIQPKGALHGAD